MIVSSLSSLSSKLVLGLVAAGWLATALASKNGDIEAGIAAYDAGDYDAALEAYAAAEETLGERAEIAYDRGLALLAKDDREAARKAFERGTESDNPQVRASSEYELGNLDFDAELWEAAIERYRRGVVLALEEGDPGTRELLEGLVVAEEEHLDWIETQLNVIEQIGIERYLQSNI